MQTLFRFQTSISTTYIYFFIWDKVEESVTGKEARKLLAYISYKTSVTKVKEKKFQSLSQPKHYTFLFKLINTINNQHHYHLHIILMPKANFKLL